jgi:hypothetical protein
VASPTSTEINRARASSLGTIASAELSVPASLPLLDTGLQLRSQAEAIDRLLCLNAVAATAYGFDRARSLAWVRQEKLASSLTNRERHFLERGEGRPHAFQVQIEGMWALAWSLGLAPELDFWKDCSSSFASQLPNLNIGQSSAELRRKTSLKSLEQVINACDLAYCLHWIVRQAEVDRKQPPAGLKSYLVMERRRALDWLLNSQTWDSLSLDT